MSYTGSYVDENGNSRTVSITEADSKEALKNDYEEIMRKYNPRYVNIQRVQAKAGEAMHLKVTVNAPSHYLSDEHDTSPKPCDSMTVDIICRPGYPIEEISATYSKDRRLASPNVFTSANACIDSWIPFTSSLITVVEKLVHDMIHDPNVTRYDSPACSSLIGWHQEGVRAGRFPTISPKLLYTPELPPMPSRRNRPQPVTPPPLPRRRH